MDENPAGLVAGEPLSVSAQSEVRLTRSEYSDGRTVEIVVVLPPQSTPEERRALVDLFLSVQMIAHATPYLTPREHSVCARIAHGEMRQRIAADLGIGAETVETYMETAAGRLLAAMPELGTGTPRQIILRYSATTAAFAKAGAPPKGRALLDAPEYEGEDGG